MNETGSQFPQLSLHLALYFLLLHFLWISFLVLLFIFFSHQRVFLSPHGSGGDGRRPAAEAEAEAEAEAAA